MLRPRMLDTVSSKPDTRPPGRHRRRAHWGLRLGIAFLLVVGTLSVAGARYYSYCQEASGPKTPVAFTVPEGSSGGEVVENVTGWQTLLGAARRKMERASNATV